MATQPRKPDVGSKTLVEELARVLPQGIRFTAHHLSTPPTVTEPLCYPPAGPITNIGHATGQADVRARKPFKTYCEKHFLTISVDVPDSKEQVLVLALEIYIYTTSHSSIIFVAKADSTGYLEVAKLPKGTPSPIREITTTFVAYLVANRKRRGIQFVVSLFARSQSQYLFPGSVKNSGKHILDDRGLVKWWCRVLDPLLENGDTANKWENIHGYLIIPGLDDYETRAFLPRSASTGKNWTLGHPLERISPYTSDPGTYGSNIPPRCLIPTYPDDPKARFVQELEESSSEKTKLAGGWKSPRTLDLFWELMAHRTECSSGRLTGFIWLVFDPPPSSGQSLVGTGTIRSTAAFIQSPNASFSAAADATPAPPLLTPESSQIGLESMITPSSSQIIPDKPRSRQLKKKKVLKGRIVPRQPRVKTRQRAHFPKEIETAYYSWPEEGRGQVVLNDSDYNRAVELLLHLEFSTLQHAVASSTRWTKEVDYGNDWGFQIIGKREASIPPSSSRIGGDVNDLSTLVKKKRLASDAAPDTAATLDGRGATINTLGVGLVRKKPKITTGDPVTSGIETPQVNILGVGLIRKKPKPA